ncbi:FAD-dependent oxidoreductase [Elusimicrobiota bacterium]
MTGKITSKGGRLLLESKVTGITSEKMKPLSVICKNSSGTMTVDADYVISTIPITELADMMNPAISRSTCDKAKELKYRSMIFLFLISGKEKITDNNWIYFPEKDLIFSRMTEPRNWSAVLAPEGKTSLCVEIAVQAFDNTWNSDDSVLFKKCMAGLEKTGMLNENEVQDYFIVRKRYCYPIYTGNYEEIIHQLVTEVESSGNIVTCGRQGAFKYGNTTDAMISGCEAAEEAFNFFRNMDT